MIDVNTGAEGMEHRKLVRWGEGSPAQSSTSKVARAGKGGIWIGGGVSLATVSRKTGQYRVCCLKIHRNHTP